MKPFIQETTANIRFIQAQDPGIEKYALRNIISEAILTRKWLDTAIVSHVCLLGEGGASAKETKDWIIIKSQTVRMRGEFTVRPWIVKGQESAWAGFAWIGWDLIKMWYEMIWKTVCLKANFGRQRCGRNTSFTFLLLNVKWGIRSLIKGLCRWCFWRNHKILFGVLLHCLILAQTKRM